MQSKAEGTAIVGKRGIRWKNGRYWSAALPTWMGRMVQIRRDEEIQPPLFYVPTRYGAFTFPA